MGRARGGQTAVAVARRGAAAPAVDYLALARAQQAAFEAEIALAARAFNAPALSEQEHEELQDYTEHFGLNTLLRAGEELDQPGMPDYGAQAAALDAVIARSRALADVVVHRGVRESEDGFRLPTAGTFSDPAYMSCSLDPGTALDFTDPADEQVAEILIPAGSIALATDNVLPGQELWGQAEIILPRASQFAVTGCEVQHGTDEWGYPTRRTRVRMTYLGPPGATQRPA